MFYGSRSILLLSKFCIVLVYFSVHIFTSVEPFITLQNQIQQYLISNIPVTMC